MLFPGVTESSQIILASYMVGSLGDDAYLKAHGLHLVPRKPKKSKKVEGERVGSLSITMK